MNSAHARRLTIRTAFGTAVAAGLLALALWAGADTLLSVFGPSDAAVPMFCSIGTSVTVLVPLSWVFVEVLELGVIAFRQRR